jgi:hypothetical protein
MTSFGFCFRPLRGSQDCSGWLHIWITRGRSTRFFATRYFIRWFEWNAIDGEFVMPLDNPERAQVLSDFQKNMRGDLQIIEEIVDHLEARGRRYTIKEIMQHFYATAQA